jgi:hypothetical protein
VEPVLRVGPVTYFFLYPLKKPSTRTDTDVMADETPEATQDPTSTTEVPGGLDASAEAMPATEAQAQAPATEALAPEAGPDVATTETPTAQDVQSASAAASAPEAPQEPDAIQPFIDKAFETIQHEVENEELGKFLRAHIKTFLEEWDALSDTAKDAYVHMMTSQLVQRKAAATRIKIYDVFKLPVPSAQTTLFESLKQSQVKPKKRQPVLLMPPNLRPTYSLKK